MASRQEIGAKGLRAGVGQRWCENDEGWQVAIFGAEPVAYPGTHTRARESKRAGVHTERGLVVIGMVRGQRIVLPELWLEVERVDVRATSIEEDKDYPLGARCEMSGLRREGVCGGLSTPGVFGQEIRERDGTKASGGVLQQLSS